MNIAHIDHLGSTLRDLFQDAADHHQIMAEQTCEPIHLGIRAEYISGLAVLGTLVDRNDRFVDQEALLIVRQSLARYLDDVRDTYPFKKRRLQVLIRQIDAVQEVLFGKSSVVA